MTSDRDEIATALRRHGVLTESLVQWLTSLALLAYDNQNRITKLERKLGEETR